MSGKTKLTVFSDNKLKQESETKNNLPLSLFLFTEKHAVVFLWKTENISE